MVQRLKHIQIKEFLSGKIETGEWPPGTRLPPILKLVTDLGVSDSTIIKALDGLVQEGRIVRRRGSGTYVADASPHLSLAQKNLRIGLLLSRSVSAEFLKNDYLGSILRGVLEFLEIREDPVQHNSLPHQATRLSWIANDHRFILEALGEPQHLLKYHPPLSCVQDGQYDSLITMGIYHQGWLSDLLALNIPTVIVDFPNDLFLDRADHVIIDPASGYKEATRYYLEQGCKRIHFVGEILPDEVSDAFESLGDIRAAQKGKFHVNPDSLLRKAALELALAEQGLSLPAKSVHYFRRSEKDALASLCKKLLSLPAASRPDAVLCHSQDAAGALVAAFKCKRIKLRGVGASVEIAQGKTEGIGTSMLDVGRTAASLLISRQQQPRRLTQKVGIPMRFCRPAGS